MRRLIVCDIDGVLIDSSARDHLIPKGVESLDNKNWIKHQSFTTGDKPIVGCLEKLNRLDGTEILFLTSRMAINDHVYQTLRLLPRVDIPFSLKHYCFRTEHDSRPSHIFKAGELTSFILNNCSDSSYDEIVLIDDLMTNLDYMADVCDYHRIAYRKIHVKNLTEWVVV